MYNSLKYKLVVKGLFSFNLRHNMQTLFILKSHMEREDRIKI